MHSPGGTCWSQFLADGRVEIDSNIVERAIRPQTIVRKNAIFAGSDLQAMGVYEAARQLGLRIPEDLSVVGFDDVQTAAFLGPALTTVRQPLQDMARAAVRMLVEALSTDDVIQPHIIMPTSLVVRNSTQQLEG